MSWTPPPPPLAYPESRIAYWRSIMAIPDSEPAAPLLRAMAEHRLIELGALSAAEGQDFVSPVHGTQPREDVGAGGVTVTTH
jgi:hypothetical protein